MGAYELEALSLKVQILVGENPFGAYGCEILELSRFRLLKACRIDAFIA